jgi:putative ABC transport system substrate-binding protein
VRRREFIALLGGSAAAWPLAARAQQGERLRRIGILSSFAESDAEAYSWVAAFEEGLRALGWAEGQNIRFDRRWAAGDVNRMAKFAKDLIDLHPEVIFAVTTPSVAALRQQTRTIPIVFAVVSDPVGSGFVESLARPGGNITGFINIESSLSSKWLALLKEVAPRVRRVALMFNPKTAPYFAFYVGPFEAAAESMPAVAVSAPVQNRTQIEAAITSLGSDEAGGLVVMPDTFPVVHRDLIISLTAQYHLPAIYPVSFYAREGGLMSYGVDVADLHRRATAYVDRILKGAAPAELPIQLPTKFEFVINSKTAKALDLVVPDKLLVAADEVIE